MNVYIYIYILYTQYIPEVLVSLLLSAVFWWLNLH